jgi:hypothetical protein
LPYDLDPGLIQARQLSWETGIAAVNSLVGMMRDPNAARPVVLLPGELVI